MTDLSRSISLAVAVLSCFQYPLESLIVKHYLLKETNGKESSCPVDRKINRYHVIFPPPYQTFCFSSGSSRLKIRIKQSTRPGNVMILQLPFLGQRQHILTLLRCCFGMLQLAVVQGFRCDCKSHQFSPTFSPAISGSLHMRRAVTSTNPGSCDKELSCQVSALISECAVF